MRKLFFAAALTSFSTIYAHLPPTMGWSTWNTYRVNISEEVVRKQADAMVEKGLKEFGYNYINIDDGFFGGRSKDGNLLIHPQRFPNGLAPVVNHIHELGLKAGIYSDAGANTCGNFWDNDTIAKGVGLYGHDERDVKFFFETLGFDFFKIDFCGGDPAQNKDHLKLDEKERYTTIRKTIDALGRDDVRINVCRWAFPGTWVSSIGSSWRISADIQPNWNAVKRIIRDNRYLSAYATGGSFNDMDILEIARGLSETEERTQFAMWCMLSSPLLIGCDLTTIPKTSYDLITNEELIAINQDSLCLQARIVRVDRDAYLYVKDLKTLNGNKRAVAICNFSDEARLFRFNASEIDLGGTIKVRDVINRKDLNDVTNESFSFMVNPRDTRVFVLEAEKRFERTVYEAETAWLERFQKLGINETLGYATYSEQSTASGNAKVSWLGNHPENWLEWRDVYCEEDGMFEMTLNYLSNENRSVYCSVNGGKPVRINCRPTTGNKPASADPIRIALRKGRNTVRLYNNTGWCPDIDNMILKRSEETAIAEIDGAKTVKQAFKYYNSGQMTIDSDGEAKVSVWSANGVKLLTTTLRQGSNAIGTLPRGIYFVLVENK